MIYPNPPPEENTGNPINPINIYNNTDIAARFFPNNNPANITNNVCKVIGTIDIGILIKAPTASNTANNEQYVISLTVNFIITPHNL